MILKGDAIQENDGRVSIVRDAKPPERDADNEEDM